MSKVKLSKKQANMIDNHKGKLEDLLFKRTTPNAPTYLDLVDVEDIVDAYFNGYELELSADERAEEKFREKSKEYQKGMHGSRQFIEGMKFIIDEFNVDISFEIE